MARRPDGDHGRHDGLGDRRHGGLCGRQLTGALALLCKVAGEA